MAFGSTVKVFIGLIFVIVISVAHTNASWDWRHDDSHEHHEDDRDKHWCGSGYPPGLHCPRGGYGDDYTECCRNGHKYACCKPPTPFPTKAPEWEPLSIALVVLAIVFVFLAVVLLCCACCSCCYWAARRRRTEYVVIRDQPRCNYSYSHGGYRV